MEVPAELCDLIRMHQKMLGLTHHQAAARVRMPRFSGSRWRQILTRPGMTAPDETLALMCVAVEVGPETLRRAGQPALAAKVLLASAVAAEPTDREVVLSRMADFLPQSGLNPEHQDAVMAVTISLLTLPERWAGRAARRADHVAESIVRDLRAGRLGQDDGGPAALAPDFPGLDLEQAYLTYRSYGDTVEWAYDRRDTDGFVTARTLKVEDLAVAIRAPDQIIEVTAGDLRRHGRHATGR